jgi:hypothetical protein
MFDFLPIFRQLCSLRVSKQISHDHFAPLNNGHFHNCGMPQHKSLGKDAEIVQFLCSQIQIS